jgi:hypothetical protein
MGPILSSMSGKVSHLTAGCTADFPHYKLLSYISILIPQDYIQLEMDWDPEEFMPRVREYLIPEIQRFGKLGAMTTSLATVQSMVASHLEDTNSLFHYIHFGFNSVTVGIVVGVSFILLYCCLMVYKARQAEATARQVDLAVRTALNCTSSLNNLAPGIPGGNLSLDGFDQDVTYCKLQPQLSAVHFNQNSLIRLPHLVATRMVIRLCPKRPNTILCHVDNCCIFYVHPPKTLDCHCK